ncbi:MAG: M48 family metallopeptidase [Candidatus Moranbacteria bacterium]|nr:M48 family metallopeptidase [Candidatus Moranbacteria bacterium]
MKKEIKLDGENLRCFFRRKRGLNALRISVNSRGEVSVSYPWWIGERKAENFLLEKKDWIKKQLEKVQSEQDRLLNWGGRAEYLRNKENARMLVYRRLIHYNQFYGFEYRRIAIRDQRTRWGSCSTKRHLNFNYRIIFLPDELVDYLIVHELCHLGEMNHSKRFWELVGKTIADYKRHSRKLRKI